MEAVGKSVGGYKLSRLLGTGTTGETFAATSAKGVEVALKLVHGRLSLMDRTEPFWNAIQQLAPLAHPYMLVPSASRWTSSGRFMLRMELASGMDLAEALRRHGSLSPRQILRIIGQVCLALEAAHARDIVHGAIKPTNIILVPSGNAVAARLTDFATGHLVGIGSSTASAAHLAPEQFSAAPTKRSDIYALGVVVVEALAGSPPVAGAYDEIAQHHDKGQDIKIPSDIPAALLPTIQRALTRDQKGRFATVAEFRRALEKWASTSPPELSNEGPALFPKEESGGGVVQSMSDNTSSSDDTVREAIPTEDTVREIVPSEDIVRVPVDDLSQLFADEHQEPETVPSNEEKQAPEANDTSPGKTRSMEERELAVLAEQASAPLRKSEQEGEPPDKASQASTSEPSNGDRTKPADKEAAASAMHEDGEDAVELPIERTVKAFVSTISPTVPVDSDGKNGESLDLAFDQFVSAAKAVGTALPKPIIDDQALAALAKVPVPEPEPEPPKAPAPAPLPQPVAMPLTPVQPTPSKSPIPMMLGGIILGGLAVFGVMKIIKPAPSATPQPSVTDNASTTEPAAAASAPDVQSAALDAAAAATPAADTAATATASADAGSVATSPDAAQPTAADATAAPPKVTATASPTKKKAAETKRPRKARKPRKRRTVKASRKPKPKKPAKKPAKKSGDWVDPFSQ